MLRIVWVILVLLSYVSTAQAQTTEALLDTLQHSAFEYFWNEANPSNGLIKDRSTINSPCSIAAVGFGLTAICIGADHGYVTRAAARDRVLTTLQTFWTAPQGPAVSGTIGYKGLFYHFLDMNTAARTWTSELSTIDTALLLAGVLDAKQYFTENDPNEEQIRALADSIYRRVDWEFMRNGNPGILMGWKPETGFSGYGQWVGYNEAMILYILALGSPTHPVGPEAWNTWTSGYAWGTQYGYTYVIFPPLFGHQYSHCWIDFRGTADAYMRAKGITYFENSRRATLAQRAYSIANPLNRTGYSDSLWGLTAGDGPTGYRARGAPPSFNDDGTLSPTAPGGSVPFAPDETITVLRNLWNNYRLQLWDTYGFLDAFNLIVNWWDTDFLGIDQGPFILMIENYRNQAVWNRFMLNADIQLGMQKAGFQPFSDAVEEPPLARLPELLQNHPNPFTTSTTIRFRLTTAGHVTLTLHDVMGREVARLLDAERTAGEHAVSLVAGALPSGVYQYRLRCDGRIALKRCVLLR